MAPQMSIHQGHSSPQNIESTKNKDAIFSKIAGETRKQQTIVK